MITQEQALNRVLHNWAFEVDMVLQETLRARLGYVPTETLENLRYQVLEAAAKEGDTAGYLLGFQDSGRIIDMRSIQRRRRPITAEENFILEWVKRRGVERFSYVPGYSAEQSRQLPRDKAASRIASAIIVAKGRNLRTRDKGARRRRWFNKTFYSQIERLVQILIREQGTWAADVVKEDIREGLE